MSKALNIPSDAPIRLPNLYGFPVFLLLNRMLQLYQPGLQKLKLTYPQFLVMAVLWEHDGQIVTEIGRALRFETGFLTPMLQVLEKRGYLTRRRQEADKRKVCVYLTPQGIDLYKTAATTFPPLYKLIADGNGTITKDDLDDFRQRTLSLLESLDKVAVSKWQPVAQPPSAA